MKIKEILGTGYMDKSFKNEKDFFAKYFTRPFLTRKARKDRPIRVKVNKKGLPEFFGVPIPSTAKPQGIKKVTKKLAGKTRTFYEPIKKQVENFADGKKKGKSRPGRVKRAGASCKGSVTSLRSKAKKASGERAKMYHWCANMKSGRKKK